MAEIDEKIAQLQLRLENLIKTQVSFQREVSQIQYEINVLRAVQQKRTTGFQQETPKKPPVREYVPPPRATEHPPETPPAQEEKEPPPEVSPSSAQPFVPASGSPVLVFPSGARASAGYQTPESARAAEKSNFEKFVGENLISKIGIIILVLGVAIGAKYAIDNNLISPLGRIIAGYVAGFVLLGLAVRLKPDYHNFSAVLLSGAMAIMYFITFAAYSYYNLFPASAAFVLMLILTAFTVTSAIHYNRQVIAHIGLVGAYAIPFLLSDDSGRYAILFTYIAVINAGILAISVKKYWKPLFYTSFFFTWATFFGWYLRNYNSSEHFNLGLLFVTVFFLTFYATFIVYKMFSSENVAIENVALIFSNSFIFYGLGYSMLDGREGFENSLGMFTVVNAAIHFAFAVTVSRLKIFPLDLLYLLTVLVLTFATISIPVQLDGNFVTLLWIFEAVFLFWIGRAKQIPLYENYAYPLMLLATSSLLLDWLAVTEYRAPDQIAANQYPVFNGVFLTSLLFAAGSGIIFLVNRDERFAPSLGERFRQFFGYLAATIGLLVLYNAFRLEIANFFHFQTVKFAFPADGSRSGTSRFRTERDFELFNLICQINYTMLFLSLVSMVNIRRFKNLALSFANLALNVFSLLLFISLGLYALGELRESYLLQSNAEAFAGGIFHILIRPLSYAFTAGLLYASYRYIKQEFLLDAVPQNALNLAFDFVFYVTLLFALSSELVHWMDIFGYRDSYKLGLSILWGIYALGLIVLGIYKHKKHLRIGAIVLFGITLAKLFFYDIAELDTISKTIVFVSLGILLLIVSFLYSKYKSFIFETEEG